MAEGCDGDGNIEKQAMKPLRYGPREHSPPSLSIQGLTGLSAIPSVVKTLHEAT